MYVLFQHYFFKSLFHKSSYTISWIHYNLYQIYNISPFLIRHNKFLKALCARIFKFKIKNLINSVKIWQIHIYNWKNDYNLKFRFCTRLEQNLLFRFVAPWCSGYHYCTTSFNWAWTQVLRRSKPCSRRVRDSR